MVTRLPLEEDTLGSSPSGAAKFRRNLDDRKRANCLARVRVRRPERCLSCHRRRQAKTARPVPEGKFRQEFDRRGVLAGQDRRMAERRWSF